MPYILHRNGLATEHFPMERRTSPLESLPDETLTQVLVYLEWHEILQVRQCCRRLNRLSKDRSVCLAVLLHYYDTVLPRPFLLPKPLRYCDSSNLERVVCNWFSARGLVDPHRARKQEFKPPDTWSKGFKLGPLPGGRFFMHASPNGNIHYHDIENPCDPPSLFIPTPFPWCKPGVAVMPIQTLLSLDILATQADEIPIEDRLFPITFNLAAIWQATDPANDETLHNFGVYQVEVQLGDDGSVKGYAAKQLILFREKPYRYAILNRCSLYGNHLAYHCSAHQSRFIAIIDWGSIPHSNVTNFPRVYLPDLYRSQFSLLPGRHLAVFQDDDIVIYNWGDVPSKTRAPDLDLLYWLQPASPKWKVALSSFGGSFPPLRPYLFKDSIRIVVPTSVGLKGINIPLRFLNQWSDSEAIASATESQLPTVVPLLDGHFGSAPCELSLGYRKGISVTSQGTTVWQCSWPEESRMEPPKVFSLPSHPYDSRISAIYFIEHSNRLVSLQRQYRYQIIDF
ncbi:hypothetical protein CC1G_08795 [Coprinopsis cinerea okayama7|uniref:F-box domain-containing protein n=1 Tax=Coprinopsis cinerea (strain Okayama-7 / 130 / ATCC MYA-4618 / FGSC 9003) TaxID=240176 RepID=A8N445_COPC7|nr:hypothetical protein CC1G_08795 [Coprinopsis cinerea okayama7\|eukprot:XP_001829640.2 hypothetical protein CC1G_08795 [Coprinopsis cinerea okayama7\